MEPNQTPDTPDELIKRFVERRAGHEDARGYTQRQKQLVDSLIDSEDDELFNEAFHKQLLLDLVSFMHDWHMRSTARRFSQGHFEEALVWLQDTSRLSLIQAQIEAIEVSAQSQ